MEITEYIPKEKFDLWLGIFKTTSGRFLSNPLDFSRSIQVRYTFNDFDDYEKLNKIYSRFNAPIIEAKAGFWKKIKNRFGLKIKIGRRESES